MKKCFCIALLLLPVISIGAQEQKHIPVVKEKTHSRDSLKVVHDTVKLVKVETVTVYRTVVTERMAFDSFFVHDSVRDTVRSRTYIPIPIPIPLRREKEIDCDSPTPPLTPSTTTTPEPATVLLLGSGMAGLLWRKRRRK